ncbi:MAG: DUF616 domain-containing protein [Bacteroidales bacterium]|nr:DUF616 domain-containing protein [Bacteroidales bacterium]
MTKIAIYTCVTGGYDKLSSPKNLPEDFGWFCFTASIGEETKAPRDCRDNIDIARWHKMHPESVIPNEYDYSVWIDGNIQIVDSRFYDIIRNLINDNVKYAGIKHPQRDDVFEEAYKIICNGKESLCNMTRVTRFLKREGMPRHSGLDETNVIFRAHKSSEIIAFDNLWWNTYFNYPHRDQMSHPYCMWKTGLSNTHLLEEGCDARTSPLFAYTNHDPSKVKDLSLKGRYKDGKRAVIKWIFRTYLKWMNLWTD